MIIDSHHHLWTYKPEDYGWMNNSMGILKRDYLPEDLEPLLKESGVRGTVVVQARQSLEETEWLLELAEKNPFILGVVGWVDLSSPVLAEQLDKFSSHPKLVGVRHEIHDEPDDDYMLRPDFVRGIGLLETHGLVYDLLLFPKHLRKATQLVKTFPEQSFVLDHLGKPLIKSGELQPWKTDIEELAALPNVWCKLSGMVTEADLLSWKQEDFISYMAIVWNCFGPDRVMLGSDWPVCTLAGTYHEVMEISREFVSELNKTEQERIYFQNAIDCYQLQTEN
ncbi:MAG: amidohydrolase [Bacteroidia bacterium]|nr:MAG: amidohydrolase [Bacteroidia bacterium]